jgi:hypothetical protein
MGNYPAIRQVTCSEVGWRNIPITVRREKALLKNSCFVKTAKI